MKLVGDSSCVILHIVREAISKSNREEIESSEYVSVATETTRSGRREVFMTTKTYLSKIPRE